MNANFAPWLGIFLYPLLLCYREAKRQTETVELREATAEKLGGQNVFGSYNLHLQRLLTRVQKIAAKKLTWVNTGRGLGVYLSFAYLYSAFWDVLAWLLFDAGGMGKFTFFEGFGWPSNPLWERALVAVPALLLLAWAAWFVISRLAYKPSEHQAGVASEAPEKAKIALRRALGLAVIAVLSVIVILASFVDRDSIIAVTLLALAAIVVVCSNRIINLNLNPNRNRSQHISDQG